MRSYVDLCLFIRFIELSEERLGQAYPSGKTSEEILALWQQHEATMPSYVFHELYHFWQGLRLPFVHRYANRTLGNLPLTLRWLAEHRLDMRAPQFATDTIQGHIALSWNPGSAPNAPLQPVYASLSPLDLLEGAASLAEFQMLHAEDERTDWRTFDRWSKRNPSYTTALDLARARLDDAGFALRAFLPLTCQAFATSDAVRAFAELVELARDCRPTRAELVSSPVRTWTDLARSLMHELQFEMEPDAEEGYCRLLPAQMFCDPPHPIAGRLAQEWEERCLVGDVDGDEYERVMDMPGWIRDEVLAECRDRYGPPFSVVRFQWKDGSHSVQVYAAENAHQAVLKEYMVPELLTTYGLLRRRTGFHFDQGTRLCHHIECPYFAANWCNTFPFVPARHEQCTFDGYVTSLTDLVLKSSLVSEGRKMGTLRLSAGERSEELLAFVTRQLDDITLDSVTVEREQIRTPGMASEPITTAVLLTVTPIVAAAISRLIERWLESRRQQTQLQIVLDGFGKSHEAGRQLAQLATKYADVSVSFGPLPPIGSKQLDGSSAAEPDSKKK